MLLFLSLACEVSSTQPLATHPTPHADLQGNWYQANDDSDYYRIEKQGRTLAIYDAPELTVPIGTIATTRLGHSTYLDVALQDPNWKVDPHFVLKYRQEGNTIYLSQMNKDWFTDKKDNNIDIGIPLLQEGNNLILDPQSTRAYRAWMKEYSDKPGVFENEVVFIRK